MNHKEFNQSVDKINASLGSNCMGVELRGEMEFIMPINLYVKRDRSGLVELWNDCKRLIAKGYSFEKI